MNTGTGMWKAMKATVILAVWTGAVLALGAASSAAAVALRLDPGLQVVPPGEAGVVSVVADGFVAIRTVEITLRGDPERLLNMTAVPGGVFDGVPCMIWQESETLEPGLWHGFAVIIGSTCETAGPGELLRWTFTAGDEGGTILDPVEVKLYAPDGLRIDDVTCSHAVVLVSATTDVPPPALGSGLRLQPNPFNPSTSIVVDLDRDAQATLNVYDPRGRRVATPWRGFLTAGRSVLEWRGLDDAGAAQPSGTYLFVLEAPGRPPIRALGSLVR